MVVSEKTIKRELHQSGYFCRVGKKRLDWAKEKKNWKNEWEKLYGVTNHGWQKTGVMCKYV